MTKLLKLLRDQRGQDMVEYGMIAGFIAVAAGATLPGVSNEISTIFSKTQSVVAGAAGTGGGGGAGGTGTTSPTGQ